MNIHLSNVQITSVQFQSMYDLSWCTIWSRDTFQQYWIYIPTAIQYLCIPQFEEYLISSYRWRWVGIIIPWLVWARLCPGRESLSAKTLGFQWCPRLGLAGLTVLPKLIIMSKYWGNILHEFARHNFISYVVINMEKYEKGGVQSDPDF